MGGGQTISNVQPAAGNLRIQTAVYGSAIPQVYGRTRISGNLAWYGGFQAIPHTSTQSSGGKGGGGGVTQENTSFTYQAAVLMVLGEGAMNNVISGWKGKLRFTGAPATSVPVVLTETFLVPPNGICTVASGSTFLKNVQVNDTRPEPWDAR